MANSEDESGSSSVSQKSFVISLKKYVLVPSNPVAGPAWTVEKQQKVLLNYWRAIKRLLVDSEEQVSVVFRTNGLELFHGASPAVFLHLANRQDFKEETIVALLPMHSTIFQLNTLVWDSHSFGTAAAQPPA